MKCTAGAVNVRHDCCYPEKTGFAPACRLQFGDGEALNASAGCENDAPERCDRMKM